MPSGGSGGIGGMGYQRSLLSQPDPNIMGLDSGGAGGGYGGFETFGSVLAISGVVQSAIGSYYTARAQQYELKSQASSLEFQQSMAAQNRRAAENDAQAELQAGQHEAALTGLRYGQVKAGARATQGARGVEAGFGSAAEELASIELAKEVDMFTINANATRAANAHRMRAVGFENQGRMAGVSAANARSAAGRISPGVSAGTSLLGNAGGVAREWAWWNRGSKWRDR